MRRHACTLALLSALFAPVLAEAKPRPAATKPGPTDLVVATVDAEALYPSGRVQHATLYDFWQARRNPQAPQPKLMVRVNLRAKSHGGPLGRRLILDLALDDDLEISPAIRPSGKRVPLTRYEVSLDDQQMQDYVWQLDPTGWNIGTGEEFCIALLVTARVEGQPVSSQVTVPVIGGPCGD